MQHLYFIRHGQSQLGQKNLWAGTTDSPLSDEGRKQAAQAGKEAVSLKISHVISSPLSRAYDTAVIIADAIGYPKEKIELSKLIIERDFGSLEGTPWDPDFDVDSITDAESATDLLARARHAYEYVQTLDAETVLLVSHGSFGRALRHIISPEIPFDNQHRFDNAKITKLL